VAKSVFVTNALDFDDHLFTNDRVWTMLGYQLSLVEDRHTDLTRMRKSGRA